MYYTLGINFVVKATLSTKYANKLDNKNKTKSAQGEFLCSILYSFKHFQ